MAAKKERIRRKVLVLEAVQAFLAAVSGPVSVRKKRS